jgi:biopolymer transport protein ExbD
MVSLSQVHMKGMKVNLPTGVSGETQNKREYVSLSVDKDGYFYFDKEHIEFDKVLPKLQAIYATSPDAKIFVRGDRDALHGNVIRLLDVIRSSGYNRIAFEIKSEAGKAVPAPGSGQ